jgi:hypothetical protein
MTTSSTIFRIPKRQAGRLVAVEFNPFQILAVEVNRQRGGNTVLEAAAEFGRDDTEGLRRWIESRDSGKKAAVPAVCGVVPNRGTLHRDTVEPTRLNERDYLEEVTEEQQKGRFLTATPFKIFNAKTWTIRAVSAVDGAPLPTSGPPAPALVCAIAKDEVVLAERRLAESRLSCERLEPGLLSLFGAVYKDIERRGGSQAVVVVVIHPSATVAYILGKEGVHTPSPILHGMDSIIEVGRKELGEIDGKAVLAQLQSGSADITKHGPKLVRRIGRDLKPLMDSFEMTTGQPVDDILCAYLPPNLSWIAEPLAQATGRSALAFHFEEWLPTAGIEVIEGGPSFGPHWLGALSLVANLPDAASTKSRGKGADDPAYARPWHVDCSLPADFGERRMASRRMLSGVVAGAFAFLALALTGWQLRVIWSLRSDTRNWQDQMTANRPLLDGLNNANATLRTQTEIFDRAWELMGENYQVSNLIMNLGRLLQPRVRIERIETGDARVIISGAVLEPAEEAAQTLGRQMDRIREHPELGPLFSQIHITSLQRKANSDAVVFELTLRLKGATP